MRAFADTSRRALARLAGVPGWAWHGTCIAVLAAVTWIEWLWLPLDRAMHAETGWVIQARAETLAERFLYGDPSRPFLQLPFGIAGTLAPNSITAINVVIAGYVLAMALLTYWLVYRLLGNSYTGGLVAATIAITFGGDQAAALFSMVILWQVMIGVLAVAIALRASMMRGLTIGRGVVMVVGSALALWTYEASAGPLLALLALVITVPSRNWRRIGIAVTPVVGMLAIFTAMTISRIQTGVAYYQASKVTGVPTAGEAADRIGTWLGRALQPWTWSAPWEAGWFRNCAEAAGAVITTPAVLASFGWLIAVSVVAAGSRRRETGAGRDALRVAIFGLALLAASYLPYLAVSDGAGHWRTHMMAQVAWGILAAALIIATLRALAPMGFVLVTASGAVVALGLLANLWGQLENAARWDTVRQVMSRVTDAVPGATPGTTIVLTNVGDPVNDMCRAAPTPDPFGDPSWFASNLRLYYPDAAPDGTYIRRGAQTPTGVALTTAGVRMPDGSLRQWDDVILFRVDNQGRATLLGPRQIGVKSPGYDPRRRIVPATPDAEAARSAFDLQPRYLP